MRHLIAALAAAAAALGAPAAAAAADTIPQPRAERISWQRCYEVFQCGTLSVPQNYAAPTGARVELEMIRKLATSPSDKLRPILFNPGGPGGSGVDMIRSAATDVSAFRRLNRRHDLVGFDPRGIGASTPAAQCQKIPAALATSQTDLTPAAVAVDLQPFVASCVAKTGAVVPFLGTADVARDMEQIRVALGQAKLDFFGFSYGAFLGATYAALFPDSVGNMVLDGADNPDEYANRPLESDLRAAAANQLQLERFLDYVQSVKSFRIGKGSGLEAYRRLIAKLRSKPLKVKGVPGLKRLTDEHVRMMAGELIATRSTWPTLGEILHAIAKGRGYLPGMYFTLFGFAEQDAAMIAGSLANSGADRAVAPEQITDAYVAAARAAAPDFPDDYWGASQAIAFWPKAPGRFTGPWTYPAAPSRVPIVVIGTKFDPRTPYEGASALRTQLGNARLMSFNGDGHTAFANDVNGGCIDKRVIAYFNGTVPDDNVVCADRAKYVDPPLLGRSAAHAAVVARARPRAH